MTRHIGMDLDGTLVSFGDGQIVVNENLIDQYLKPGDSVDIITNQGGVTLGYRSPQNFIDRLLAVQDALVKRGITDIGMQASAYHPKASRPWVVDAATSMMELGGEAGLRVYAWTTPETRKPEIGMIEDLELDLFIGDSDEDEQAAAAAGVPFIRVPRFMGGEG